MLRVCILFRSWALINGSGDWLQTTGIGWPVPPAETYPGSRAPGVGMEERWSCWWCGTQLMKLHCPLYEFPCCRVVAKSCLPLCGPMDCSLQGSSVHEILQARIMELGFPPPGDLLDPGIKPTFQVLYHGCHLGSPVPVIFPPTRPVNSLIFTFFSCHSPQGNPSLSFPYSYLHLTLKVRTKLAEPLWL